MANVFLSYQSQQKKTAVKLRDALKSRGFKTLFDADDKKAVEKAAVVIMCMSASYKACKNCKKEIDQAKSLKKPIIRILVEAGFKPSGWLAVASGSKMVIDFSDQKKFKEKFEELLKELATKKIKPKAVGKKKRRKKDDKDDEDSEEEDDDGEDGDDNDGGEDKEEEDGDSGDGDNDEGGDDNEDVGCCGGGDDDEGGEGDDEDGCGLCCFCLSLYRCLSNDQDG